ncbi:MAG: hypothetical protein ACJA1C_000394 [Crocinitomicaceae bacterium]|jgi:hypothetical protein
MTLRKTKAKESLVLNREDQCHRREFHEMVLSMNRLT